MWQWGEVLKLVIWQALLKSNQITLVAIPFLFGAWEKKNIFVKPRSANILSMSCRTIKEGAESKNRISFSVRRWNRISNIVNVWCYLLISLLFFFEALRQQTENFVLERRSGLYSLSQKASETQYCEIKTHATQWCLTKTVKNTAPFLPSLLTAAW